MKGREDKGIMAGLTVVLVMLSLSLPLVEAGRFKLINKSDFTVYVARAWYKKPSFYKMGDMSEYEPGYWMTKGWTNVRPGRTSIIHESNDEYVFVRMEFNGGREIHPSSIPEKNVSLFFLLIVFFPLTIYIPFHNRATPMIISASIAESLKHKHLAMIKKGGSHLIQTIKAILQNTISGK